MESPIRLDRLATWDEVCDAISFSFHDAFELGCTCTTVDEMEPGFDDRIRILAERIAWLALAGEMLDPLRN